MNLSAKFFVIILACSLLSACFSKQTRIPYGEWKQENKTLLFTQASFIDVFSDNSFVIREYFWDGKLGRETYKIVHKGAIVLNGNDMLLILSEPLTHRTYYIPPHDFTLQSSELQLPKPQLASTKSYYALNEKLNGSNLSVSYPSGNKIYRFNPVP